MIGVGHLDNLNDSIITVVERSVTNGMYCGKFHWILNWTSIFPFANQNRLNLVQKVFPSYSFDNSTKDSIARYKDGTNKEKSAMLTIRTKQFENIQYLSLFFEVKWVHICKLDVNIVKSNAERHFLGSFSGKGLCYKEDDNVCGYQRSWQISKALEVDTIRNYSTLYTPNGLLTLEGVVTLELDHPSLELPSLNFGLDASMPVTNIQLGSWIFCQELLNLASKGDSKGNIKRLREWFTEEPGDPEIAYRITSWYRWDIDTVVKSNNVLHPIFEDYYKSAYSPPIDIQFKAEKYSFVLRAKKICIEGKDFLNFKAKAPMGLPENIAVSICFHETFCWRKLIISDHVILKASDAFAGVCLTNVPLPLSHRAIGCLSSEGPLRISCKTVIHRQKSGNDRAPKPLPKRAHTRLEELISYSKNTIVGLEFVIEIVIQSLKSKLYREYNCILCQHLGKVKEMFDHLNDISHKFNVLKRRYPDSIDHLGGGIDEGSIDKEIDRLNIRDNDKVYKITKINRESSFTKPMYETRYFNQLKATRNKIHNAPKPYVEDPVKTSQAIQYQNNEIPELMRINTEPVEIKKNPGPLNISVVPVGTNSTKIIYTFINKIKGTFKDWDPLKLKDELKDDDDLKRICTLVQEMSKKIKEYHVQYSIDDVVKTEILHAQVDAIIEGQCVIDGTLKNSYVAISRKVTPTALENG